jgi:hypothetical protein
MNVFATDHPLLSQTSLFDTKRHPALSYFCSLLVAALVLFPLVFGYALYLMASDDAQSTGDYMTFGDWLAGTAGCFAVCLFCAWVMVSIYRLAAWMKESSKITPAVGVA